VPHRFRKGSSGCHRSLANGRILIAGHVNHRHGNPCLFRPCLSSIPDPSFRLMSRMTQALLHWGAFLNSGVPPSCWCGRPKLDGDATDGPVGRLVRVSGAARGIVMTLAVVRPILRRSRAASGGSRPSARQSTAGDPIAGQHGPAPDHNLIRMRACNRLMSRQS
jgi:hypothetical protein